MVLSNIIIEPFVRTGDILTLITIIISLFSILRELRKERFLRQKEQADKVRDAAALIVSKLDRWEDLSLSIFQGIDALFVETSEKFKNNFDPELARDFIWAKLSLLRGNYLEKILNENIEISYAKLYSFDPSVRPFFDGVIKQLKEEEDVMFQGLLEATQNDILYSNYEKSNYKTSELRNSLMNSSLMVKIIYEKRIKFILDLAGDALLSLISRSDEDILKIRKENFDSAKLKFPVAYPDLYSEKDSIVVWGELDKDKNLNN
jgi:hypothetical protein